MVVILWAQRGATQAKRPKACANETRCSTLSTLMLRQSAAHTSTGASRRTQQQAGAQRLLRNFRRSPCRRQAWRGGERRERESEKTCYKHLPIKSTFFISQLPLSSVLTELGARSARLSALHAPRDTVESAAYYFLMTKRVSKLAGGSQSRSST